MKCLDVYIHDIQAGKLWQNEKNRFVFQYAPHFVKRADAHPLSLSLPFQDEPFEEDRARPFFSNLLPEGDIRDAIARIVKVSKKNDMALLEKIGGECAGAVSVLPEGLSPVSDGDYVSISFDELDAMIGKEPQKPLLIRQKNLRLSLAGAQDKLPVFFKEDQFFFPTGKKASSHIIKPQNRLFYQTVQNEAFCMKLAKAVGLPVPDVFIWKGREHIAYVIQRYDRIINEDGVVLRIHQEDFCQALGLLPEQKYQSEGGPGLTDCFNLLQQYSVRPMLDRKQLVDWVLFNYLIGNADAHAKNISILFDGKNIRLAPFYDLMSTLVYPDLIPKLSMKVGKENRFKWLQKRHMERFALEIGVKPSLVLSSAKQMAKRLSVVSEKLAGEIVSMYGGEKVIRGICGIIKENGMMFL